MRVASIYLFAGIVSSLFLVYSVSADAATENILYSFCSQTHCTDGATPISGLTSVNGALFGTTPLGGNPACNGGCGTVFSLDLQTGAFTTLYSFCQEQNCADGADPASEMISLKGQLYGTTVSGGGGHCPSGCGTVFAIAPETGSETVVYTFKGGGDGANPYANPINVSGTLYGTTALGGTGHVGTVFSLDPKTGAEVVLYSFRYNSRDGNYPEAPLVYLNGSLYGTTQQGGAGLVGTLFSLNPETNVERILYAFNFGDGAYPGSLIHAHEELYGTTGQGGGSGGGTVFSFVPKRGPETILYSFCSVKIGEYKRRRTCADGYLPAGRLRNIEGSIYGTTVGGGDIVCGRGSYDCGTVFPATRCHTRNIYHGCGTVFSVDTSTFEEEVLYSFGNQEGDGLFPYGGLVQANGTFYGTTKMGGAHGKGTVFAVTP